MQIAVQTGQVKVVQALLTAGADVNAQSWTDDGKVRFGGEQTAAVVASMCLPSNPRWPRGRDRVPAQGDGVTALHLAISRGDRNLSGLLMEQPEIDLNAVGTLDEEGDEEGGGAGCGLGSGSGSGFGKGSGSGFGLAWAGRWRSPSRNSTRMLTTKLADWASVRDTPIDASGASPLWAALCLRQSEIAEMLVNNGAC